MSEIRTISIKNFKTHSGAIYPKINLYYQQFGRQIGKAPIVLVNHSLTGDANLTGDGGWWSGRCNGQVGDFPVDYVDTSNFSM